MKTKQAVNILAIWVVIICITPLLNPTFAQNKIAKGNWPQFRGVQASGLAEAPDAPVEWNVESGFNIKWRVPIQGLGLSSPVIWGNKVFITTAVGEGYENVPPSLKVGLYGNIDSANEDYPHLFQVICLDKNTGNVLWKKTAHKGVPQVKRHTKASHANCSVATDGNNVVAFFGSEGLYCYNMDGDLIWKKDLGYLNPGFFAAPDAQWGFSSSPVIHRGRVITQCDINAQSFLAAFDVKTGEEIWRTNREEEPTFCTPTVVNVNGKDQIVVNGWHRRGGYDFETGKEIWYMDGGGDIPVPTPIIAHGMSFYNSAHGRLSPIYAIKLEAQGDISLKDGESTNDYISWSNPRRGAYLPTPIIVGDYLYIGNNIGILTCYKAKTGEEIYRERIGGVRGSYTSSPVSSGKSLYFSNEEGDIHVIQAGSKYKLLATNSMNEPILATPAMAGKMLFIRTNRAIYGIESIGAGEAFIDKEAETVGKTDKIEMPVLPKDELKDPTEIFKVADAVAKAIHTVQYDISVKGIGALEDNGPQGTARVTESGWGDFTPDKFLIDGEVSVPGTENKFAIKSGSDGNKYYILNDRNKTVHADFEYSILGPSRGFIRTGLISEFVINEPFSYEIEASDKTLNGTVDVEGEICYEILLKDDRYESTYYISTKDYALRKRTSLYVLRNGQLGGSTYILTNVVINPELPPDFFKIPVPKGYTVTSDALP